MRKKHKIAFGIYLLLSLGSIIFGLVYLFSSQFMPYHQQAIGKNWSELEAPLQILLLALMRGVGCGAIGSGLAIGILTLFPFRGGNRWAVWTIPIICLVLSIPGLYATLAVRLGTPGQAPWGLFAFEIICALVAFILSYDVGETNTLVEKSSG